MDNPDTRYAVRGDYGIAYQVLGEGPDLVYLPQFLSNVVWNWQMPEHAAFMTRLASFSRLIVMDPSGVGASDGPDSQTPPSLEDRVADIGAVLAATMSWRATVFGGGRSAFLAMTMAATQPDRLDGLVLFAPTPSWRRSEDLPWEDSEEELKRVMEQSRQSASSLQWATSWARSYAPSLPESRLPALAAYGVTTGGRLAQVAEQVLLGSVDLRPLLPTIRVPTLVMHRRDDPLESIESGRYVANAIPEATLVELPGRDALPWVGESEPVLDAIEVFMTGERRTAEPERVVATLLFTDIVDSTASAASIGDRAWREIREQHDRIVREEIRRSKGREIKTMGDGFLVTFDSPAHAIACAVAVAARNRDLGVQVRSGVHTGEIQRDGDDVAGLGVTIGARIAGQAGPAEVLVSQTVRDLVAGSGLVLDDAGEHELKGVPDRWRLYRVVG